MSCGPDVSGLPWQLRRTVLPAASSAACLGVSAFSRGEDALAGWHRVEGRFDEALSAAWKIDATRVVYPSIMIAVSASRLGQAKVARAAISNILAVRPNLGDIVADDLARRALPPCLIAGLVRGLRDAGLASSRVGTTAKAKASE